MAKGRTGGRAGAGILGLGGGGAGGGVGPVIAGGGIAGGGGVAPAAAQQQQQPQQQNSNEWANMTDAEAALRRRQMGQTGDEAGKLKKIVGPRNTLYIQSAKSYLINNFIRFGNVIHKAGYMTKTAWDQYHFGFNNDKAIAAIRKIDSGMKPTIQDHKFNRYEGEPQDGGTNAIELFTGKRGLTIKDLAKMSPTELNNMFSGKSATYNNYISTSWRVSRTSDRDRVYMSKPVKYEYTVKAGTHAIFTNNIEEHEVLLGRGYDVQATGARMENGQLVISVTVDNKHRSGYKKI